MNEDKVDELVEEAYVDGCDDTWRKIVRLGLSHLHVDVARDAMTRIARLELEHAELRRVLRELWNDSVPEPWPGDDVALDSVLSRFSDYILE